MRRFLTILFILISTVSFAQIGIVNYDTIQSKAIQVDSALWIKYLENGGIDTLLTHIKGKVGYVLPFQIPLTAFDSIGFRLDSSQLIGIGSYQMYEDTLIWDATKTDLLNFKNSLPEFATLQEALIGIDSIKIISPLTNSQVDSLRNVPYVGALEDIYTDYNISADSLFSNWGLIDSIVSGYYKAKGTVIINEFSDDHTLSGNSNSVLVTERAIKQFVQNAIQGGVVYLGSWNANTNTPTIANSTGNLGDMYAVSVTGTQDLGSGSVTYTAGGFVIHNGTVWEFIGSDAMVVSVNNFTGAVHLYPELTGDSLFIVGNDTGVKIGNATSVSGNTSAITAINNTLSTHNTRIIALEGLDTTGVYHVNRAVLDAIDETWNDFTEWDKDYFDLINRPNFQDSITTYQTDNQQLSIDSLNRVFTITLEDGGSVKFLDTNTQYDLDSLVSGIRDSVDYLYIWDKSQSDSLIYLYTWNTNQSDSLINLYQWNINQSDSIENIYTWNYQQGDSISFLYDWNFEQSDTLIALIDSINNIQQSLPEFATLQEALIGMDNTKLISPLTNRQVDSLVNVPYIGALENIYSNFNITVDTLVSSSMEGIGIRAVAVDERGRLIDTTLVFDDIVGLRDSVITNINRITEISDSVIYLYGWNTTQSDSIENNYIWNFQQSDSIQFLYEWNANQSDSVEVNRDSIDNYNDRLLVLESIEEVDPVYSLDSTYLKTHVRNDNDLDPTNELQNLSINNHVISLTQSIATIDLTEYINPDLSYLEERDSTQSDSISALFNWNNNQSDSLLSVYQWNYLQSDTLIDLSDRLSDVEGFDTTGVYHWNRSLLDKIGSDDTLRWNLFFEWDKDYFDLINLPNITDSINTYQTDNQQLSIDSTNRVFIISLENGGSVKFEDTNTIYDLSGYATRSELHDTANVVRSEFPTMLTELDSTGFRITESQISDLQDYLIDSDLTVIENTLVIHSDSLGIAFDSLSVHRVEINNLTNEIDALQAVSDTVEVFYATPSQTSFTLANEVTKEYTVSQNGIVLPTTAYSINTNTLTVSVGVWENDRIQINYKY